MVVVAQDGGKDCMGCAEAAEVGVAAILGLRQGLAATEAAAATTMLGTLTQPSSSSYSRGSFLLFFSQMTARVCGGGGC